MERPAPRPKTRRPPRAGVPMRSAQADRAVVLRRSSSRDVLHDERILDTTVSVNAVCHPRSSELPKLSKLLETERLEVSEAAALAELAFNLHQNGRNRLARAIFEGLTLLQPENAYAHLGAGLMNDFLGAQVEAETFYDRARRLAPGDARPDLNQAELRIQAKDRGTAAKLVALARTKARRAAHGALLRKAEAMGTILETTRPPTRIPSGGGA